MNTVVQSEWTESPMLGQLIYNSQHINVGDDARSFKPADVLITHLIPLSNEGVLCDASDENHQNRCEHNAKMHKYMQ